MSQTMIFQIILNGLMLGMIYVLIASGLCLIFGIMRIVNFAHGEFYMFGAFVTWLFFAKRIIPLGGPDVLRYIAALILSMIVVGLLGIIVERFIYRLFRDDMIATVIIAMSLTLILQVSALGAFGIRDKNFVSPFTGNVEMGSISMPLERVGVIIAGAIFITLLYFFIQLTQTGKSMRAVAQNTEAASVLGIKINRTFSLSMGIGCALAGAGGGLMAPVFYVNPYMGVEPIMKAFVAIIVGGMGSLPGAVIAGFIVGFAESFFSTYMGSHVAMMVVFLMLIVLLLIKPTGILGRAE